MASTIRVFACFVFLISLAHMIYAQATAPKKQGTSTISGKVTIEGKPAPGKYLLLARPMHESEADEMPATPTAWDAAARLQLRREAESAGNLLELNSCQRVNDYSLKFSQAKK